MFAWVLEVEALGYVIWYSIIKDPMWGKGGQNVTMMVRFIPSSTNKFHVITHLVKWLWIQAKVLHVLFLWRCKLAKL